MVGLETFDISGVSWARFGRGDARLSQPAHALNKALAPHHRSYGVPNHNSLREVEEWFQLLTLQVSNNHGLGDTSAPKAGSPFRSQ